MAEKLLVQLKTIKQTNKQTKQNKQTKIHTFTSLTGSFKVWDCLMPQTDYCQCFRPYFYENIGANYLCVYISVIKI
jgi:hypothetical protein